jgi:hypothetical protein
VSVPNGTVQEQTSVGKREKQSQPSHYVIPTDTKEAETATLSNSQSKKHLEKKLTLHEIIDEMVILFF